MLRGVAVLAVVLAHLPFAPEHGAQSLPLAQRLTFVGMEFGGLGVDLFIVISGFCIHLPTARSRNLTRVDFWPFWKRRQIRLYPPYIAVVGLSLAGLYFVHRHGAGGILGAAPEVATASGLALTVMSLVFLFQNFTDAGSAIGNGPLWTLGLEEQLYALYFLLLRLRRSLDWNRVLKIVAGVAIGTGVVARAATLLNVPGAILIARLPTAYWLHWVLGAFCVEALLTRRTLPSWCGSPLVAIGCFVAGAALVLPHWLHQSAPEVGDLFPEEPFRSLSLIFSRPLFAFAGFALVNRATAAEVDESVQAPAALRLLRWIGTWSYSLYLVHQPAFGLVKVIAVRLRLPVAATYGLRFGVALIASYAFHRVIERYFHAKARASAAPNAASRQEESSQARKAA